MCNKFEQPSTHLICNLGKAMCFSEISVISDYLRKMKCLQRISLSAQKTNTAYLVIMTQAVRDGAAVV